METKCASCGAWVHHADDDHPCDVLAERDRLRAVADAARAYRAAVRLGQPHSPPVILLDAALADLDGEPFPARGPNPAGEETP